MRDAFQRQLYESYQHYPCTARWRGVNGCGGGGGGGGGPGEGQ